LRVVGFVQAIERRRNVAERLSRMLSESDLDAHEVLYQAPGHGPWEHFWHVLETMAASDAELVIRFEEDALAGKHLKHNCVTWPVIRRPKFGCGWLYSSPASILDYIYQQRLDNPSHKQHLDGSVAVLFWRKDLEWMIPAFRDWAKRCPWGYAYDFCISGVMREKGYELWCHDPPIVEHDRTVASGFGHNMMPECSTMGLWRPNYRRVAK